MTLTRSALAAVAALGLAATGAQAIPLVGLTSAGELARFDTADIAGTTTRTTISGLAAGERLVGIDLRPGDGRLYGISTAQALYTLDESSGAATRVATLSVPVVDASLGWGIDFNPVADFNGATSLRFVSSAGGNYAVNANTGVVGNTASNIGSGFTAVAYSNSLARPVAAPAGTALYYIDSSSDLLKMAPGAFNSPSIVSVGALGVDVLKANGFEIAPGNIGYAALNIDDGSLATGIFRIDLTTGAATRIGSFDGTLNGLSVSAVPEPQSLALMLAGLGLVGVLARRRGAARQA